MRGMISRAFSHIPYHGAGFNLKVFLIVYSIIFISGIIYFYRRTMK